MTDSELRQAFSKGFANPQHLHDLLSRTDLPSTRRIDVRHHLSQAYLSRQISDDALQRFVSQLNKAKNLDQFDQVLAELRVANRLIESEAVAKNSLVFTSAKKGRPYHFRSTTIEIEPVHEADILYLGTDGLIHLLEVKNTANALRQKLKKNPKQLDNMLEWRKKDPNKRKIRMVIATEAGWTQVFATRQKDKSVLQILKANQVPLTIGEVNLTLRSMNTLWNATVKKIIKLRRQNSSFNFSEFYRQMSTLAETEQLLGVSLS